MHRFHLERSYCLVLGIASLYEDGGNNIEVSAVNCDFSNILEYKFCNYVPPLGYIAGI